MVSDISEAEITRARERSLTPLGEPVLFRGSSAGATVTDISGREYIDCTSQAYTLGSGYVHPDVLFAVQTQMSRLTHVRYTCPTISRIKLINCLTEILQMPRICFNNAGAGMAVEAALKLAIINRPHARSFIVMWRGYHGNSLALVGGASHPALGLIRFEGFGSGRFVRVPYPYCYRCPVGEEYPGCGLRCLDLVKRTIETGLNTPAAGLLIEPMQGSGGQVPTPPNYLKGLKQLCEDYGILLIYDEAQTGFGRIGKWCAAEYYGVWPDLMAISKALGGGFPIGATMARIGLGSFTAAEEHTTFGSNPIMFAAALANIEVIRKLDLLRRAETLGNYLTQRLRELQDRFEIIGDIRGPGLFIGVELVKDRSSKEPADKEAGTLVAQSLRKGVMFELNMPTPTGAAIYRNVVKIKPPLTITEQQLDRVLQVLEEGLKSCKQ
jgi:4-aminobutyrate aminotransferase-like enzyme